MLKIAKKLNKKGSAMLLTMFILASMLIVAMSGAYLISMGLKSSGVQSQSIKAYFAAETGAEKFLWELRKNGYSYIAPSGTILFSDILTVTGATYNVYFTSFPPLVFTSIGEYQSTKRSVEVRI